MSVTIVTLIKIETVLSAWGGGECVTGYMAEIYQGGLGIKCERRNLESNL